MLRVTSRIVNAKDGDGVPFHYYVVSVWRGRTVVDRASFCGASGQEVRAIEHILRNVIQSKGE